jgi:hypothetical protein
MEIGRYARNIAEQLNKLSIGAQIAISDQLQRVQSAEGRDEDVRKARVDAPTLLIVVLIMVGAAFVFPFYNVRSVLVAFISLTLTLLVYDGIVCYTDFALLKPIEKTKALAVFLLVFVLMYVCVSGLVEFAAYQQTSTEADHMMC